MVRRLFVAAWERSAMCGAPRRFGRTGRDGEPDPHRLCAPSAEYNAMVGGARGRGVGTAATKAMVRHGLFDLNLHRIYVSILRDNIGSIKMCANAGFREEGTIREGAYKNGRYHDLILMGVLKSDLSAGGDAVNRRSTAPEAFADPVYVTRPLLPPLAALMDRLREVWDSRQLTNIGLQHERLEAALRIYLDVPELSLFTNGTVGLITAIRALGLTGEVLTTPFTFPATPHALSWSGITPVFCDVDPLTLNIDRAAVEQARVGANHRHPGGARLRQPV